METKIKILKNFISKVPCINTHRGIHSDIQFLKDINFEPMWRKKVGWDRILFWVMISKKNVVYVPLHTLKSEKGGAWTTPNIIGAIF